MNCWFDGQLVQQATISVMSHSLHYGGAVFEGIRFYDAGSGRKSIFRLGDHVERLLFSAEAMGMRCPYSREVLEAAIIETMRVSGLADGYIRPIVFLGEGFGLCAGDLPVHTAIYVFSHKQREQPLSLDISELIRMHPRSTNLAAKVSGHYANSLQAARKAQELGADDALLLDYQGFVAETSVANVFFVREERVFTPMSENIFPGLTRRTVFFICESLGIPVAESHVTVSRALAADAMFIAGSASGLLPVARLNHKMFDTNNEFVSQIVEQYEQGVRGRVDVWPKHFLTKV